MAYTPLIGNDVDIDFTASYTPSIGNDIDFDFTDQNAFLLYCFFLTLG